MLRGESIARSSHAVGLLVFLLLLLLPSAGAQAAAVGGKHSFDAFLSLTGGTGTSASDPVPDPGATHPPVPFRNPCGTVVDDQGDVYVGSTGVDEGEGRIDIFKPNGEFITEVKTEYGPCGLGVDGNGILYVRRSVNPVQIVRYTPSSYPPTPSSTYGAPVQVPLAIGPAEGGIQRFAVNQVNDHLIVAQTNGPDRVIEYGSASEGNPVVAEIGEGVVEAPFAVAVDGTSGDIFVSSGVVGEPTFPTPSDPFPSVIYVFDSAGDLKGTIDGADTPEGGFVAPESQILPAVDEVTGEVFVSDLIGGKRVYRFVPVGPGSYEFVTDPELEDHFYSSSGVGSIAVSNAEGALNDEYVFIGSPSEPISHLFAFSPEGETGPPIVSGTTFGEVSETEVSVAAEINPHGRLTSYFFEYVSDAQFEEDGFASALLTPEKSIGGGTEAVSISQVLTGLSPGTAYHFRVIAQNCEGDPPSSECVSEGELEGEVTGPEIPHVFATFASPASPVSCPNSELRVGPSALLPDCRAYEVVSPADPKGHPVTATNLGAIYGGFPTSLVASDGQAALFETSTGAMPGFSGNGYLDRYRSTRQAGGWVTQIEGPTGSQMEVPNPGGASSDLTTSFWKTSGGKIAPDSGSLVLGAPTAYVRRPDGTFELLGEGSLGFEPEAPGKFISTGGAHVIFTSRVKLEEGAPATGVEGIYDRTLDGTLHVISVLPGELPPPPTATVEYLGSSADGSAVAFTVSVSGASTTYVRVDNDETIEVAAGPLEFAGLSSDGDILTYVQAGNAYSFDVSSGTVLPIGTGGKSTVVNVSADGSHVYFVSTKKLLPIAGPVSGKQNFYVWERETSAIAFIGIVTESDVLGDGGYDGLGLWTAALAAGTPAQAASRTTEGGRFIAFESRANLMGHVGADALEVYLYDSATGVLQCVSCNPTLAEASGGAYLETVKEQDEQSPLTGYAVIHNLAADGQMVFFETTEALVARDTNEVQDVYEWEAAGRGGCNRSEGCLSLISLGRGSAASYLYGVSSDGSDVFFVTRDTLVPGAVGGTPTLYDARINGGFALPVDEAPCQLDGCQVGTDAGPALPSLGSAAVAGRGNARKPKHCGKNRRKVKRHGKVRCVKKKRAKHRSGSGTAGGQGGSR